MKKRHFQLFARGLDLLLKVFSVVTIVISLTVGYTLLFSNHDITFSFDAPTFSLFRSYETPTNMTLSNMAAIVGICSALVDSVLLFKGSQFFARVSQGQTPFTGQNYRVLKYISWVMMATSLIWPLLYSLLVTLNMQKGYYMVFGLSYQTFMGLMIYMVAEIIYYGMNRSGADA